MKSEVIIKLFSRQDNSFSNYWSKDGILITLIGIFISVALFISASLFISVLLFIIAIHIKFNLQIFSWKSLH